MRNPHHTWSVVLAGGDGLRMAALTRDRQGQHVPKQYCRFGPGGSLLQRALRRAARHSDASHTLVVVQEAHREWWAPVLAHLPQENILVQPTNQGTGVALLHVVSHVLEHDRDPYLLVMPSDHEVDDEDLWRETLRHALRAVHESPDHLVMVAVDPPDDPEFGWLLPGRRSPDGTQPVLSFVERPNPTVAAALGQRGALVSTFTFAASAHSLLSLFLQHAGELLGEYVLWLQRRAYGSARLAEAHRALPIVDFSRDMLERAPSAARVLHCPPCGWTDLGTPQRLLEWYGRRLPETPRLGSITPLPAGLPEPIRNRMAPAQALVETRAAR